jgi:hypothetical protein
LIKRNKTQQQKLIMSKQFNLLSSKIHQRYFNDAARTTSLMTASAMAGMSTMYFINDNRKTQTESRHGHGHGHDNNKHHTIDDENAHLGIIETDFTEKIASKSYLNYHNPFKRDSIFTSATNTSKRIWNKLARNDKSPTGLSAMGSDYYDKDSVMNVVSGSKQLVERPKGVPRRIRILAIDVPEFREVFDGECRVNLSRIYPDDIAPSKYVDRKKVNNSVDSDVDVDADVNADVPRATGTGTGIHNDPTTITNNKDHSNSDGNDNNSNNSSNDSNTSTTINNDNDSTNKSGNNKSTKKDKKKIKATKKETKKKNIPKKDNEQKIEIIQKSLARSLVRCRNVQSKRIGVELLEASVYDLNPHNMRRTYQFGSYRYDPGKYGSMKKMPGDDMLQRRMTAYGGIPRGNPRDMVITKNTNNRNNSHSSGEDSTPGDVEDVEEEEVKKNEATVLASDEDEVDAPWNQYAWIEEMELRIHGRIPFGANVEPTSWITRRLFNTCYRTTVKKVSSSPLLWLVPSFLIGNKPGGTDGIDGDYGKYKRTLNRASSKPHAVIADGSAMQRVPGSLRYLTKCCEEAGVPLFIINDPRVWGGNTHRDLASAAKDMKRTMKARIVANALQVSLF